MFHFLAALARAADPRLALGFVDTLWVLTGFNCVCGPALLWSAWRDVVWRAALAVFVPGASKCARAAAAALRLLQLLPLLTPPPPPPLHFARCAIVYRLVLRPCS